MEVPDKIYLYREQPKDYFEDYWNELPASDVENIAYVRKDAVTQVIREYLENWLDAFKIERLTDKIEEL